MKTMTAILFSLAALTPAIASDGNRPILPPLLQGIGIDQHLNGQLPLDTEFRDESGSMAGIAVVLRDVTRRFQEMKALREQLGTQAGHGSFWR